MVSKKLLTRAREAASVERAEEQRNLCLDQEAWIQPSKSAHPGGLRGGSWETKEPRAVGVSKIKLSIEVNPEARSKLDNF